VRNIGIELALGHFVDYAGNIAERCEAATQQEKTQGHYDQDAGDGGQSHMLHGLVQHGVIGFDGVTNKEQTENLVLRVNDREVGGVEFAAKQDCRSPVRFCTAQRFLTRMLRRQRGTDRALAILRLQVGGAADELPG